MTDKVNKDYASLIYFLFCSMHLQEMMFNQFLQFIFLLCSFFWVVFHLFKIEILRIIHIYRVSERDHFNKV